MSGFADKVLGKSANVIKSVETDVSAEAPDQQATGLHHAPSRSRLILPLHSPLFGSYPPPPCCRSSPLVLQLSPAQQRALMAALQDKFKGKGVKAGGADKWSHDGFDNMQG